MVSGFSFVFFFFWRSYGLCWPIPCPRNFCHISYRIDLKLCWMFRHDLKLYMWFWILFLIFDKVMALCLFRHFSNFRTVWPRKLNFGKQLVLLGPPMLVDKTNFGLVSIITPTFIGFRKHLVIGQLKEYQFFSAFHWSISDTHPASRCITVQWPISKILYGPCIAAILIFLIMVGLC